MSILIVTSVQKEAEAIGDVEGARIVVGGIGRTNAAAATTEAVISDDSIRCVVCAGIAGALPGSPLEIGDSVVSSACIYTEEGMVTPDGFSDMQAMGFALGDFAGNAVPVDPHLLAVLRNDLTTGPIATVATCSGTNAQAHMVARRTGAVAEAMEGAAVVHAARRLHVPAIELRTISNTTGDRAAQQWDIRRALTELGVSVHRAVAALSDS